jgi:hypothetical protein
VAKYRDLIRTSKILKSRLPALAMRASVMARHLIVGPTIEWCARHEDGGHDHAVPEVQLVKKLIPLIDPTDECRCRHRSVSGSNHAWWFLPTTASTLWDGHRRCNQLSTVLVTGLTKTVSVTFTCALRERHRRWESSWRALHYSKKRYGHHHATHQTIWYLNDLTLITDSFSTKGGYPLVGDQPPWKREHAKLQLPEIHHGRGNTQKTMRRRKEGRRVL